MVVVTGATGHIGNVLVRELLSKGYSVTAIIPGFEKTDSIDDILDKIEIIRGDILDYDLLKSTIQKNDVVYHLAAIVDISPDKIHKMYEINVSGTENMISACLEKKAKRLLYVSSSEARTPPSSKSENSYDLEMDESCGFNPEKVEHHYQKSKAIATLKVKEAITKGLDAVIVTPTGVLGPYDFKPSLFGGRIKKGLKWLLHASVEGSYDFVDVRDVAKGMILICEKGKSGEDYILSGENVKVSDLLKIADEETGKKSLILQFPYSVAKFFSRYKIIRKIFPEITPQSMDVLQTKYKISHRKAEKLGYKPRPIRQSLKDTVNWFLQQARIKSYVKVKE